MASVKSTNNAIDILNNYQGQNPYILMLKRDVLINKKSEALNDFSIEYINNNYNFQPRPIQKVVKMADWWAEQKKEEWNAEFPPKKLKIYSLLGETSTTYHCVVQYRQSIPPQMRFLSKKAVLTDFLSEDYNNLQIDFDRYDKLSMLRDPNRRMKEHQKTGVKFLLSRKKCILADDMGYGKMEPVSAMIPTPDGFKRMGDIKPGDYVFSKNGEKTQVLRTYPHKDKEIYRVNFTDGTYAECGLEHLWIVRDANMRRRNTGWKTMSLKEMIDSGLQYNNKARSEKGLNPINKYEIPVTSGVEYPEREYFIDPYIMGVALGDGNLCNGSFVISIPDIEIETKNRIEGLLSDKYTLKEDRYANCPRYYIVHKVREHTNDFIQEAKKLGVNVNGLNKFIPEEYKLGSKEQRIELLRGLMDSDGTIDKGNRVVYFTSSEKLANDVMELVFSLGGIARKRVFERKGRNKEYSLSIQTPFNPFHMERKAERWHLPENRYCTKHILSAEYVRNEDAQCIAVDSEDHSYLTGHSYIVTHNTLELTVAAIEGNFDSVLIVCPASIKTTWKDELMWYVPERDITIIEGINDKNKSELETYLGYGVGKSGKKVAELKDEAKERGKWQDNRFVIVNYDILDEFYEIPATRSRENIEKAFQNSPMLQYIYGKKSLIIIDEAHRLSNTTSNRYKILKDLIKRGDPDSIYEATGTPITNSPMNFFNVLQLIGANVADDYNYYVSRYCNGFQIPAKGEKEKWTKKYLYDHHLFSDKTLTFDQKDDLKKYIRAKARMITIPGGESNLDELKERTSHIYLRRVKEDLKDMSKKTIHEMYYNLTMEQQLQYYTLWDEYEAAQLEADPTKEVNKELLEGGIYRRYLSVCMVPNTINLVNELLKTGEKVIIGCCYDDELYQLKDYYKDICVIYNGKCTPKEKDRNKDRFLNDPSCRVFIGNIQAAGVGLTLTVATKLVFSNFSYVPGDNQQFMDRIHRINQTKDVDIYFQIFRGTQYEKMWEIIMKKELVINSVIKKEDEK